MVSRQHIVLEPSGDGVEIADLGSTNGTSVNGERLVDPRRLEHGDVIQIGKETIEIEIGELPSGQWPTPSGDQLLELLNATTRTAPNANIVSDDIDTEREIVAAPTVPAESSELASFADESDTDPRIAAVPTIPVESSPLPPPADEPAPSSRRK